MQQTFYFLGGFFPLFLPESLPGFLLGQLGLVGAVTSCALFIVYPFNKNPSS